MRLFRTIAALLVLGLLGGGAAVADDPLHLELQNGSKFDGRIAGSDDASITFKPAAGGEIRIAWKDLDAPSWLTAKKVVVDPADGKALLELAKFAAEKSMREEAETLIARAVRIDGSLKAGAESLAPRLAELRHAEAVALFERGQAFLEKSSLYQALGRFQEARKLEPGYALAINGVGEAYFSMRRLKEARKAIEEAIVADGKCKDALFNRAYLELLELDFKACLTGLAEVVALPPSPGKFGTREEVFKAGKDAGIAKPEEAWKKFADSPLLQARDLKPVMEEIVKGPGFAQEFSTKTAHYDLRTDVSQEYADLVAARLELVYAEYDRRYGYEKTGETKTRGEKLRFPVLVFKTRDEYVAWFSRVLQDPAMAAATGGVYVSIVKHLVFFQNKEFEDTQLVAWHEGFHQYLDYYAGNVPLWFNEGQAEYYGASTIDKSGKRLVVGQTARWRVPQLNELLKQRRIPPAEWLMRCPQREFMRLEAGKEGETSARTWTAGENYATSWALVHFCIEGDGKRWSKTLLAYFKLLCDGTPSDEAFERAWGRTDWAAFDSAFEDHCEWLVKRAIAERDGRPVPPMPK